MLATMLRVSINMRGDMQDNTRAEKKTKRARTKIHHDWKYS